MKRLRAIIFLLGFAFCAMASDYPRVDVDIKNYDEAVSAKEKLFAQIRTL